MLPNLGSLVCGSLTESGAILTRDRCKRAKDMERKECAAAPISVDAGTMAVSRADSLLGP